MKKITSAIVAALLFVSTFMQAQQKTQSIIYDATTLMNASHGVNALLIPTATAFDIENPLTRLKEGNAVSSTPSSFLNAANSETVILEILIRNDTTLKPGASKADVMKAYKDNPFLKNLLSNEAFNAEDMPRGIDLSKVSSYEASNLSGGIGHDLLGNLVNGTADFLIKRAQEEISIAVFQKLKQFITRYPELDTLFPATCALIKPVNAYEYNKALDAFKAAIKIDLQGFVSKVPALYSIPRYNEYNKRVPALTFVFSACSMFTDLHGEKGLAESLYDLGGQNYLAEENNYASFIKVLTQISNSLLDKTLSDAEDKTPNYIHVEFIEKVTHGKPELMAELGRFYLGLLWQHIKTIEINSGGTRRSFASLLDVMNTTSLRGFSIKKIDSTLKLIRQLDTKLGELKKEEIDNSQITGKLELKAKRFTMYAEIISGLMNFSALFTNAGNANYAVRVTEIVQYLPDFTTGVSNVIRDFSTQEYSLGISEFEKLLKVVSSYLEASGSKSDLINDLQNALNSQKAELDTKISVLETRIKTLQGLKLSGQALVDAEGEIQELTISKGKLQVSLDAVTYQLKNKKMVIYKLSQVIEYIHLFASITKAENSQAVEELLETYALPAGSSRIKKVAPFNIAVNAYVGGFGGRTKDLGEGFTNRYGLTAPIGFTISHGFKQYGSISLFLGAFDIGGTIRYKLDNQGKYQQDISLAGIVSPGVHGVYGFPGYLPLSVGVGCQWISPTTSNTNKIDLKATFNAFVAVDIPLFNLTGVKKK